VPKGCAGVRTLQCVPIPDATEGLLYFTSGSGSYEAVTTSTFAVSTATGGTGHVSVDTMTLLGQAGTRAAGLRGFEYRVDMSQASTGTDKPCIESLQLPSSMPIQADFNGDGVLDDCYVITSGTIGTAPVSAVSISDGGGDQNVITASFGTGVCAGQFGNLFLGFLGPGGAAPLAVPAAAIDNSLQPNATTVRVPGVGEIPAVPPGWLALLAASLVGVGGALARRRSDNTCEVARSRS
jgi:hypothetical protein